MKRCFLILSLLLFLCTVSGSSSPYYLYEITHAPFATCGGNITASDGQYNGNVLFVPTRVQLVSAFSTHALFYGGSPYPVGPPGVVTMTAGVFDLGDAPHDPRAQGQGWSASMSPSQMVAASSPSSVTLDGFSAYSRFDFVFPTHPTLLANHWYFVGATITSDTAGIQALQAVWIPSLEGIDLNLYYQAHFDGSSAIYMPAVPSCWDLANAPSGIEVTTDATPPTITMPAIPAEVPLHQNLTFTFAAIDESGVASLSATLDGLPLANGATRSDLLPGVHTVAVAAVDGLGNRAERQLSFTVVYVFGGFLPPVVADGGGIYKQGRTLPVQFVLTDVNGVFASAATALLFAAKVSDGIAGDEYVALSSGGADSGNQFRVTNNEYIFNLATKTMAVGTWQLSAHLDDGQTYGVTVSLK